MIFLPVCNKKCSCCEYVTEQTHFLTEFNGALYFSANDGVTLNQPWKTDGTAAGTVLVKNIGNWGGAGSFPNDFTVFNGALYFQATGGPQNNLGMNNYEIWKTDGTDAGTVLVKDLTTTTGAISDLSPFAELNGALYFSANDGVNSRALWKTDGTDAGTVRIKNINAATGTHYPAGNFVFTKFNGALYFSSNDGVTGNELWRTDGTASGTVLIKDINTVAGASSNPAGFTELNSALYFSANDGINGTELWKTDGTAAGTVLVKDISTTQPGEVPTPPASLSSMARFISVPTTV
ncbi:MAG: ELWxxDGT repeat protein [Sulfuricaulis sp.]